jgi:hypothetical protein
VDFSAFEEKMVVVIGEIIKVGAVFGGGKVLPKWFVWKGRKYEVEEITYTWKDKNGRETLHHFSVTDGSDLFELCYREREMSWYLASVEVEGG